MSVKSVLGAVALLCMICSPSLAERAMLFDTDAPTPSRGVHDRLEDLLRSDDRLVDDIMIQLAREKVYRPKFLDEVGLEQADIGPLEGDVVGGNPDGDVTIIVFFDYRCVPSKTSSSALARLLREDSNIRVVYKELPFLGEESLPSARVALALSRQSDLRYQQFHFSMMSDFGSSDLEASARLAHDLGADMKALAQDYRTGFITDKLTETEKLAEKLVVLETPVFIVGNRIHQGKLDFATLKSLVHRARLAE